MRSTSAISSRGSGCSGQTCRTQSTARGCSVTTAWCCCAEVASGSELSSGTTIAPFTRSTRTIRASGALTLRRPSQPTHLAFSRQKALFSALAAATSMSCPCPRTFSTFEMRARERIRAGRSCRRWRRHA